MIVHVAGQNFICMREYAWASVRGKSGTEHIYVSV